MDTSLDALFDFLESPVGPADARSLAPKDTAIAYTEVEAYACHIPPPEPGIPDGLHSKTGRVAYAAKVARIVWPCEPAALKKAVAPLFGCDGEHWDAFAKAFEAVTAGGSSLSLLEWLYWRMDTIRGKDDGPPKLDKEGNPKPRAPHFPWKVVFDVEALTSTQMRAFCHKHGDGRFVEQTIWPLAARALYEVASGQTVLGSAELAHFKSVATKQQRIIQMAVHPAWFAAEPRLWLGGATVIRDLGLEEVATLQL